MSLHLFKPSRCVLLIGDDALYIYNVLHNTTKLLDSVPWGAEGFEETVATIIRKDCPGKAVLLLNDMTDQHFKGGQRLPKIGPLDKSNVLHRRLHVAFPNFPIRGALPVKGESRLYLFSAVPMSEPILRTFDAVKRSMAPIAGLALLPVESADMVKQLSASLEKEKKSSEKHQWTVFMGQHQNGALRQVITRHGQLAMTRMTPIAAVNEEVETWADEVSQEFKATISYLSRFGYSVDDGTQVIVVARPDAGRALQDKIDTPCTYTTLTMNEAARLLGTTLGYQQDLNFADVLHVAWAGRKPRLTLPMDAPDLERIHKPRQAATFFILILLAVFGYLSWTFMGEFQKLLSLKSELKDQQYILADVEVELKDELERMEELGFDVNLIEGAMGLYSDLEKRQMRPLPFLKSIGTALGPDLRLDLLDVRYIAPKKPPPSFSQYNVIEDLDVTPELVAVLQLSFPSTLDIEVGYREVRDLARRLSESLPLHAVEISRQVAGRDYKTDFKGEVGSNQDQNKATEHDAEITIRGPAQ